MWTTSSGTSSGYYQPYTPYSGTFVTSGNTMGPLSLPEDTRISCKLEDGTIVYLTLKEYILFITIHGISPSECKDIKDYEEKMGAFII